MSERRKQGKKSYNVTNPNKIKWVESKQGDFIYKFRDYKVIVEKLNSLDDRRAKYNYFNKAAGKALIEFRNLYGLRGNY